jgi:hypothetical protein
MRDLNKFELYGRYLFLGAGILTAVGLINYVDFSSTVWSLLLTFIGYPTLGYFFTEAVKRSFGKLLDL